jgi:hypothetical protein
LNVEFRKLGWLEWRWLEVFIAPTTILAVAGDGAPDCPVVHQIGHCSVSGVCHVNDPLGFGAVDHWSPLSYSCTGHVRCVLTPFVDDRLHTGHVRALYTFCRRPLAQVTVAPLAHRTCLVHTGQSGEL